MSDHSFGFLGTVLLAFLWPLLWAKNRKSAGFFFAVLSLYILALGSGGYHLLRWIGWI